eukprot:3402644-Prymnesium_polylepis.2
MSVGAIRTRFGRHLSVRRRAAARARARRLTSPAAPPARPLPHLVCTAPPQRARARPDVRSSHKLTSHALPSTRPISVPWRKVTCGRRVTWRESHWHTYTSCVAQVTWGPTW